MIHLYANAKFTIAQSSDSGLDGCLLGIDRATSPHSLTIDMRGEPSTGTRIL